MPAEGKLQLFNRMVSTLDELKPEFVEECSKTIAHKIIMMEEIRTSLRIGLYAAFKNEVRTDFIFQQEDQHRKELYYPAVDVDGGGLGYFRVIKLDDLKQSISGMREPTSKQSRLRDLNILNVLIVPGVAFDLQGGRMGYGKGFYDKKLLGFSGKRIALAYDFQVVGELPQAVRGRKLDWIVTEKRIIRCQR